MQIRDVRMNNRNRTLYVFEFASDEDEKGFFETLKRLQESCKDNEELYNEFQELCDTLKNRCDAKYAREGVVKSSSLFQDEMIDWYICFFRVAIQLCTDRYIILKEKFDLKYNLLKEKLDLINECIELRRKIADLEGKGNEGQNI